MPKGKEYLIELIPNLKTAGVKKLIAHYNGEGDSGTIEEVTAENDEGNSVILTAVFNSEEIMNAFYEALETLEYDWVNNDGGFGDVILYVNDSKLVAEHNHRISDTEYHEQEL